MPNCAILNCSNSSKNVGRLNGNISFHRFPRNPDLKAIWIEVTGRVNWSPTKFSSLCSLHFTDDCFKATSSKGPKRRLKNTAVPTVAILRNLTAKATPQSMQRLEKLEMVCRICLCTDRKMYNIKQYNILRQYEYLIAIKAINDDDLPQYVCWECKARLASFSKLRTAALRSLELLKSYYNSVNCGDEATSNLPFLTDRDGNNLTSALTKKVFKVDHTNYRFKHTETYKIQIIDQEVKTKTEYFDDIIDQSNVIEENCLETVKTENDIDNSDRSDFDETNDNYENKRDILDSVILNNENDNSEQEIDKNTSEIEMIIDNSDRSDFDEANDNYENKCDTLDSVILNNGNDNSEQEIDINTSKIEMIIDNSDKNDNEETEVEMEAINKKNRRKSRKKPTVSRKNDINSLNKDMFDITELSYEEQMQEIEKRKQSENYRCCAFKCDICFKGFTYKDTFLTHLSKHTNQFGAYECDICKVRYKFRHYVKNHKTSSHSYKYSCKSCNFVTTIRSAAKLHEKYHIGVKYNCPHCDKEFERRSTFMSHIRIKHPSDVVCELCGYSFINQKGLIVHKNLKHRFDERQVPADGPKCEQCNVQFVDEEARNTHYEQSDKHEQTVERKKRSYKNYYRNMKSGEANERRDRRHNTGPVECEVCETQLPNSMAYNMHFRKNHPGKNRTYFPIKRDRLMCEVCGRTFVCLNHLQDHSNLHSDTKQFACEQCGKRFETKTRLRTHGQIHMNKQHTCNECGKVFTSPNNLSRHMINHSGLKFECEVCGKCFKHPMNKKAHVDYVHLHKPLPKRNRNKKKQDKISPAESASPEEPVLETSTC